MTHTFLACDERSSCRSEIPDVGSSVSGGSWGFPFRDDCSARRGSGFPASFTCDNGVQRVPYSLLCDHRQDCRDGSDERFCVFPPCQGETPLRCGQAAQVIAFL